MDPKDYFCRDAMLELFRHDPKSMTASGRYHAVRSLVERHDLTEFPDPCKGKGMTCFSKKECLAVWHNLTPLAKRA